MKESKTQSVRNIPPFGLRMQPDLKEKLNHIAKARDISLNELITSTLSDVYRPEDASNVVILNLPKYLSEALTVFTDYHNRPIEYAILDVLREVFPNATGIQAVHDAEEEALSAFDDIEDSLHGGEKVAMRGALLDLLEIYGRNFKHGISENTPPPSKDPADRMFIQNQLIVALDSLDHASARLAQSPKDSTTRDILNDLHLVAMTLRDVSGSNEGSSTPAPKSGRKIKTKQTPPAVPIEKIKHTRKIKRPTPDDE